MEKSPETSSHKSEKGNDEAVIQFLKDLRDLMELHSKTLKPSQICSALVCFGMRATLDSAPSVQAAIYVLQDATRAALKDYNSQVNHNED